MLITKIFNYFNLRIRKQEKRTMSKNSITDKKGINKEKLAFYISVNSKIKILTEVFK